MIGNPGRRRAGEETFDGINFSHHLKHIASLPIATPAADANLGSKSGKYDNVDLFGNMVPRVGGFRFGDEDGLLGVARELDAQVRMVCRRLRVELSQRRPKDPDEIINNRGTFPPLLVGTDAFGAAGSPAELEWNHTMKRLLNVCVIVDGVPTATA